MPMAEAKTDDPPYDIKGNVIPLVGMRCNEDAIFIIPCNPKEAANPAVDKIIK